MCRQNRYAKFLGLVSISEVITNVREETIYNLYITWSRTIVAYIKRHKLPWHRSSFFISFILVYSDHYIKTIKWTNKNRLISK